MQVRNYMTGAAAVTHPDEPVVAAARLMRMRGIGALPVCEDDGTLAGMLTDRDIVVRCVSSGDDPGAVTVRSIMSRDPVTVEAGARPQGEGLGCASDTRCAAHLTACRCWP